MIDIRLENINKVYQGKKAKDNFHAVKDFSLEIKGKEFVVFVGPSGCGKSTTLRMIAGLEDITSGSLYMDDELMNKIEPQYRNIAMVFQNYALYPHMSAYKNMAFGLKNMTVPTVITKWVVVDEETHKTKDDAKIKEAKNRLKSLDKELGRGIKQGEVDVAKITALRGEIKATRELIDELEHIGMEKVAVKEIDKKILSNLRKELKEATKANDEAWIKKVNEGLEYYSTHEVEKVRNRHLPKQKIDDEIFRAADILGIVPLLYRLPGAMSGGQRQRVALGRAIVRTPRIFLLDEPLSNLDAKLRGQMRVEITKLYEKLDIPFIYVTHDQVEAMTMGTRIVVMRDGVTQQIDTPTNLYDYPENRFVAGFLGTPQMNFYEVTLVGHQNGDLDIALPLGNSLNVKKGESRPIDASYLDEASHNVIIGVRPEDFLLGESGIKAKVSLVENLGNESIVYCDFDLEKDEREMESPTSITVKVTGRVNLSKGDIVNLGIKKEKIHLFDAKEEKSILGR